MKLKFLKPYPNSSITKPFDDIEINDFTIITGKNGIGKTHLLEAIIDTNNFIDIDDGSNTVYFNYNDFIVENTKVNQQRNKLQLRKKNSNQHNVNQYLNDIKNLIRTTIRVPLLNSFQEHNQLINQIHNDFSNKISFLDFPSWEIVRNEWLSFSTDEELLKKIYLKLKEQIDLFSQQKDSKFDKYYEKANSLKIPFQQLNEQHFQYQESWLGQLLEQEFKEYIKNYERVKKRIEYEVSDEITKGEIKEIAKKEVGVAPWTLLNEILETYSCNGYVIDKELSNTLDSFINLEQQPLNIKLKNYETGIVINSLDRLSSGEKTLFALAVTLYRQEKDETLPNVLLLDEIDSSLHPSMCKQLLDVLENIFVKKYGLKIIMVTHSPSTVALAPDESVYLMENNDGKINLINRPKEEAVSFLSDGFLTFEEGIGLLQKPKPQIYLEGTTDIDYWNKTFELFEEFKDIIDAIEIVDGNGGESKRTYQNLSKIPESYILSKHIFVFDCDEQKQEKIENKLSFIKNDYNENSLVRDGIENLFSKDILEKAYESKNDFFKKTIEEDRGQTTTTYKVHPDEKRNLCNWICENGSKEDFEVFLPILKKVREILNS